MVQTAPHAPTQATAPHTCVPAREARPRPVRPVDVLAVLPLKQLARLVTSGQVEIRRLGVTLRQNLRAWGERNKVAIP